MQKQAANLPNTSQALPAWDDLRIMLAAVRAGSLAAAARQLSVNETTVARRLTALEQDLGMPLFARRRGSLEPTQAATSLLHHIEAMENSARSIAAEIAARRHRPYGTVRVSASPSLSRSVLAPRLPRLITGHPDLTVILDGSPESVNLEDWEADIAVRLKLPDRGTGDVLARRLGAMPYAPYAAINAEGPSRWIQYGPGYDEMPEARWISEQLDGQAPILISQDPVAMAEAAEAGIGGTLLPCIFGDTRSGLRRVNGPVLEREIWLLQRRDLKKSPAVSTVVTWIEECCIAAVSQPDGE